MLRIYETFKKHLVQAEAREFVSYKKCVLGKKRRTGQEEALPSSGNVRRCPGAWRFRNAAASLLRCEKYLISFKSLQIHFILGAFAT